MIHSCHSLEIRMALIKPALWLGHLTGLHYQTLMPTQSDSMPPIPDLRKVEDTLQAKAHATVNGGDQQSCQPGISKASGVGKVSLIHSQWNSSGKHSTWWRLTLIWHSFYSFENSIFIPIRNIFSSHLLNFRWALLPTLTNQQSLPNAAAQRLKRNMHRF